MLSQRKVKGWERRKNPMLNTEVCQKILAICQTPAPDQIAASITWYLVVRTLRQGQSHTSLLWIKCTWLTFFKGSERCSTTHLSSDLSLAMTFSRSPKSPFLYPDSATSLLLGLYCVDWEVAQVGDVLPKSLWGALNTTKGEGSSALGCKCILNFEQETEIILA